jgi:hypothetical protein
MCYDGHAQSRVTTKVESMKIEFTRAEIERIILLHANTLIPGYGFNETESRYSSIPNLVTVSKKEEDESQ